MATKVLIVGGGASGVLLAIHLSRDGADAFHVTILERRPSLGAGVAYATNQPDHLLNVRASNMSAFPDDPGHFAHWLQGQDAAGPAGTCGPDSFAPRHRYRDYLGSLLEPLVADGRLLHIQAEAISVRDTKVGVEIASSDGVRHFGGIAVIATNEGPGLPAEPWRFEGWTDGGHPDLAPDAPVVVVGTGLTMVDRVLSLLQNGHVGNITAVSRRGLPPQVHRPATAQAIDGEAIPFGQSASHLTGWIRQRTRTAERMGLDWRSVVDAMRPHTQTLWHQLPLAERGRFLRHARPYWDVHRHRIAPDAARQLEMAKQRGQLQIIAAHVAEFVPQGTGVEVRIARRGAGSHETIHAEAVFECRGRVPSIAQSENPVLRDMLRTGLARPDALGLGLAVTTDCAVIDITGNVSDRCYAVGPVTSGTFWEIVAIPDIRQQAQLLARHLSIRTRDPG